MTKVAGEESMKNILLFLSPFFCWLLHAMELPENNNNNNIIQSNILIETKDNKIFLVPLDMIPASFGNKITSMKENVIIKINMESNYFTKLQLLLETEKEEKEKAVQSIKVEVGAHQVAILTPLLEKDKILKESGVLTDDSYRLIMYDVFAKQYPGLKLDTISSLLHAALYFGTSFTMWEVFIRYALEKYKAKGMDLRHTFPPDKKQQLTSLLNKWYFLLIDKSYKKEDDFTVCWQEITRFCPECVKQLDRLLPRRDRSNPGSIKLSHFHLDSTHDLEKYLEGTIIWQLTKHIYLDRNCLQNITFLRKTPNIYSLQLAHNKISQLDVTNFTRLRELNVSSNYLKQLPLLAGCSMLSKLFLANNKIERIAKDELKDVAALEEIDLADNKLYSIHPDAFISCPALRLVDLSRNQLKQLEFKTKAECLIDGNPCLNSLLYHE